MATTRLLTARMTDATLVSAVDNGLSDLETTIASIFGCPMNTNITASPFGCDNSGRITKTLLRTIYAGDNGNVDPNAVTQPIGLDINDSVGLTESQLCISRWYDAASGSIGPRFFIAGLPGSLFTTNNGGVANYAAFAIKPTTGELYGKPVSTSGQGLIPQSSGSASEYFNGLCGWSQISAFVQQGRMETPSAVTMPTGTTKTLSYTVERLDTSTMVDVSGSPTVITCRQTGKYHVSACVGVGILGTPDATKTVLVSMILNGATTIAQIQVPEVVTSDTFIDIETIYSLTSGDTIRIDATQDSGSDALPLSPGSLEMHQIA